MKETMILITVLALVFIPNIVFKNYLKQSGNEIISIATELREKLENNEFINQDDVMLLKEDFLKKERVWILLVNHDMLDEIEYEVEECVAHYNIKSVSEFVAATLRLKDEIEDLTKREEISFANIL